MTLLFAFVARGTVVLAEHATCSGNFQQVAFECLSKLTGDSTRFTYKAANHLLNFVIDDGLTYMVVSEEGYPREICWHFLEQVQQEFKVKYLEKATTASSHAFDRTFGPRLKHWMTYCDNNPGEISKLHRIKKNVDDVKSVMVLNIQKALDRGEKLDILVEKGEDLKNQAGRYQKQAKSVHTVLWWQNLKMKLLVASGIALVALIIFSIVCFTGSGSCLAHHQSSSAPAPKT